ncbi:unannotated protein [freshwater metagenome]|uniref:Unannotated protein n=1 Tax=freshwater metagenome TaxID=449393 RepID=A0A6J7HN44_9ZZZZ|nr:hypothetical protein [Actinomycetota bacterium]
MRTLVISDLHLGSIIERDVLRRPAALARLEAALAGVERLVLLGDTVELLEGRPDQAAAVAAPIVRRIAAALPAGAPVIVVPGNHDHDLIRPWLRRRLDAGQGLQPATRVPISASPLLSELAGWLRAAGRRPVEVRYPSVWLGERLWATHGHYLDRLLGAALRGRLREDGAQRSRPEDFEQAPGADAGGVRDVLAAALPDALGDGLGEVIGTARRTLLQGLPVLAALPGMREAASLAALVMEQGIHRRAAIPAMAEVARRLHVPADTLIFGHIHRRGPLVADPLDLWRPDPSGPRLLNSGSWVFDSALVGRERDGERAYRPGGAILIGDDGTPTCMDLLADLSDDVLRGRV